jgi:ubiquinone/menaquinone biosynthesis C-methylase UbiE
VSRGLGPTGVGGAEGTVFDQVAADYDRVRPDYPEELVDAACVRAGLRRGSRVAEVGCGTGKLTAALLARGLDVDAVDPGAAMVAVARDRLAGAAVRFHVVPFEQVELPAGAFGAVFSATAFHWVDPGVSWAKSARLLRPGGALALLTHVGAGTELDEAYLAAWREVLPEAAEWSARDPETLTAGVEERIGDVSKVWSWLTKRDLVSPDATRLFADVQVARVALEHEETVEESLAHTRTTSAYLNLDAGRRARLEELLRAAFARAGGVSRGTTFAILVSARRR